MYVSRNWTRLKRGIITASSSKGKDRVVKEEEGWIDEEEEEEEEGWIDEGYITTKKYLPKRILRYFF